MSIPTAKELINQLSKVESFSLEKSAGVYRGRVNRNGEYIPIKAPSLKIALHLLVESWNQIIREQENPTPTDG